MLQGKTVWLVILYTDYTDLNYRPHSNVYKCSANGIQFQKLKVTVLETESKYKLHNWVENSLKLTEQNSEFILECITYQFCSKNVESNDKGRQDGRFKLCLKMNFKTLQLSSLF